MCGDFAKNTHAQFQPSSNNSKIIINIFTPVIKTLKPVQLEVLLIFHVLQQEQLVTLSHIKSFLASAVPHIRLFLVIIMMLLKRCVAKENYLIALLRNEATNKFLMSGPWLSVAKLRLLSFTVARWRCLYLIFSSCYVKFSRQSWKWLISL